VKKLPWTSLALLVVTYSTLGWQLYAWSGSWRVWLLGAAFVLLMAFAFTTPAKILATCLDGFLKSDTTAFISMILGAFAVVAILRWLTAFAHFLLLLSASALARLDMELGAYSELQAFAVLAVVSLSGFGLGLLMYYLY